MNGIDTGQGTEQPEATFEVAVDPEARTMAFTIYTPLALPDGEDATSGPWAVDPEGEELVIGPDGKTIAIVTVPFSGDKEHDRKVQLANTRLIATAVNDFTGRQQAKPREEAPPYIGCFGLPESE